MLQEDYVPGTESEFVSFVEEGMRSVPTDTPWARGVYRISMGGQDPVDSSPIVFRRWTDCSALP
jgi:hypothetical protein